MRDSNYYIRSAASIITWLVVFGLSMVSLNETNIFIEAGLLQLLVLLLVILSTNEVANRNNQLVAKGSLIMMLIVLVILIIRVPISYFFIYFIIWISIAPHYFSQRKCWLLLVLINVIWFASRALIWQQSDAFLETLLIATFYVFALISSLSSIRAEQANYETQALNRDLVATQHLLGDASRENERTRISRDIHDLLGHHLTALAINLQVTSRLTQGDVKDRIDKCHALSKLLLSDVREVVTTLRDAPVVDLEELLTLAIRDIPNLIIDLDIEDQFTLDDVNVAEVVLRVVQEAITNSLKHSKANRLTIEIVKMNKKLCLTIVDDGEGAANYKLGNGLLGMMERVKRVNGTLSIVPIPHMQLNIIIPLKQVEEQV